MSREGELPEREGALCEADSCTGCEGKESYLRGKVHSARADSRTGCEGKESYLRGRGALCQADSRPGCEGKESYLRGKVHSARLTVTQDVKGRRVT